MKQDPRPRLQGKDQTCRKLGSRFDHIQLDLELDIDIDIDLVLEIQITRYRDLAYNLSMLIMRMQSISAYQPTKLNVFLLGLLPTRICTARPRCAEVGKPPVIVIEVPLRLFFWQDLTYLRSHSAKKNFASRRRICKPNYFIQETEAIFRR